MNPTPPRRPGTHGLLDCYGVSPALLQTPEAVTDALRRAAHAARATILGEHCHHFGEQRGVTAVLLLAESHISIHTWPEHRFAALDLFLCGSQSLEAARQSLLESFTPARHTWQNIARGDFAVQCNDKGERTLAQNPL